MSFLFVDAILDSTPGEYIKGIKRVSADDYYLIRDWQGQASFPGALIGETLGQLAAWNVMAYHDFRVRPVAGIAVNAQMLRSVKPGETLVLESYIDKLDDEVVEYHSRAMVDSECVFSLGSALGPLLPMEQFICRQVVMNQYEQLMQAPSIDETTVEFKLEPQAQDLFRCERVLSLNPGHAIKAEYFIDANAAYFPDHFPLKPVLPMTVLLESMLQLGRYFLDQSGMKNFRCCEIKRAKMNDFVTPGSALECSLAVKSVSDEAVILSMRCEVDKRRVCAGEARFYG